jgi:hypothetical protein
LTTAELAGAPEDDAAGVDDDVDAALELVLADELLLLLLPHAAIAAAPSSNSAASSGLHLVNIQLLRKFLTAIERISISKNEARARAA